MKSKSAKVTRTRSVPTVAIHPNSAMPDTIPMAARVNPSAMPMDRDQALANEGIGGASLAPPGYSPREG